MDRLSITRRLTQAGFVLILFLLPVFDILRYDAAAKELYLFGQVWTLGLREGFYADHTLGGTTHVTVRFLLKAVLPWVLALSVFPLLGVFFGRFFCGWLCPEGALFELADHLSLKISGRRGLYRKGANDPNGAKNRPVLYGALALALFIAVPPLFGVLLSGYFIAPERIWREVTTLELSFGLKAGIAGVSSYMIVTSVFVRHVLCKYVCAAGLMQMLFGWVSPLSLRVRFHREDFARCTDCRGCEKVCFMDVKPRSPQRDINCVNCGACISACRKELGTGLFGFSWGGHEKEPERIPTPPATLPLKETTGTALADTHGRACHAEECRAGRA